VYSLAARRVALAQVECQPPCGEYSSLLFSFVIRLSPDPTPDRRLICGPGYKVGILLPLFFCFEDGSRWFWRHPAE
jgi:hypothetical protein